MTKDMPTGKETEPLRILIVDDIKDIVEVLEIILVMDGMKVRTALSYKEALGLVEKEPFDLVLTDYKMSRMHGIDLLDMIKTIKKDMPVIMMSAYWSEETMQKARAKGVDKILSKPFTDEALRAAIKEVMMKYRI
jgi:CheY-like chemotaxis protein